MVTGAALKAATGAIAKDEALVQTSLPLALFLQTRVVLAIFTCFLATEHLVPAVILTEAADAGVARAKPEPATIAKAKTVATNLLLIPMS
jgi:hypothetical protein